MNTAKTLLNFVLSGALLGILVASWAGPNFIGWYNETPLAAQAVGAGIGALVFLVLGILFARRATRRARLEKTPPAAPGATA